MARSRKNLTVLVVEDSPADFFILKELLLRLGDKIEIIDHAYNLREAENLIKANNYDLSFVDLGLQNSDKIETLRRFQNLSYMGPIIILTGLIAVLLFYGLMKHITFFMNMI